MANSQPTVDQQSTNKLINSRPPIDQQSTTNRPTVDHQSTNSRPTIDQQMADRSWQATDWFLEEMSFTIIDELQFV